MKEGRTQVRVREVDGDGEGWALWAVEGGEQVLGGGSGRGMASRASHPTNHLSSNYLSGTKGLGYSFPSSACITVPYLDIFLFHFLLNTFQSCAL